MQRVSADLSTLIVQVTPEIGKLDATFVLATLFSELFYAHTPSALRQVSDIKTRRQISQFCQIFYCLASTQLSKSPVAFLLVQSAVVLAACIEKIPYLNRADPSILHKRDILFRYGSIAAKVVNSFAIGLLAQRTFSKTPYPGMVMALTTTSALALSVWNEIHLSGQGY